MLKSEIENCATGGTKRYGLRGPKHGLNSVEDIPGGMGGEGHRIQRNWRTCERFQSGFAWT